MVGSFVYLLINQPDKITNSTNNYRYYRSFVVLI
jgi:hypothetical protein